MLESRLPLPYALPVRAARCWVVLLGGLGLSLSACNADTSMARSFGQGGTPADDVRVSSRPPLSLPPDYTLRPDRPGVTRSMPASTASTATSGSPGRGGGRMSAGQSALLELSGPAAPADIRAKVNEDARLETPEQGFTDELMSWQRPPGQPAVIQRSSSSGSFLSRLF